MANRRRVFKVAEKVRAVLANELLRVSDPRFIMVTITSVIVSHDLRHVKAYWMVSGGTERRDEVQEAFDGAAGVFKRALGQELGTRFVPEVRFYYDDTLDTSEHVERLLSRIRTDSDTSESK